MKAFGRIGGLALPSRKEIYCSRNIMTEQLDAINEVLISKWNLLAEIGTRMIVHWKDLIWIETIMCRPQKRKSYAVLSG